MGNAEGLVVHIKFFFFFFFFSPSAQSVSTPYLYPAFSWPAAFRIENALNAKEKSVLAKITENQMDTVILKRKKILLAWQEDRSFWF